MAGKSQSRNDFYFANDAKIAAATVAADATQPIDLEDTPANSSSGSSWSRIFDRFRPTQDVAELPRTDIEVTDEATLDGTASLDSGF